MTFLLLLLSPTCWCCQPYGKVLPFLDLGCVASQTFSPRGSYAFSPVPSELKTELINLHHSLVPAVLGRWGKLLRAQGSTLQLEYAVSRFRSIVTLWQPLKSNYVHHFSSLQVFSRTGGGRKVTKVWFGEVGIGGKDVCYPSQCPEHCSGGSFCGPD